jgi:hypothetical protein
MRKSCWQGIQFLSVGILAAGGLLGAGPASAVPVGTYSGNINTVAQGFFPTPGQNISNVAVIGGGTTSGSASVNAPPNSANASVTISSQPAPTMSATGTVTSVPVNGALTAVNLDATYSYYFQILGPDGFVPIGVQATGQASVDEIAVGAYSNNLATARLSLTAVSTNSAVFTRSADLNAYGSSYAGPTNVSFTENGTYNLVSNQLYMVSLYTFISTGMSGLIGGGTETLSAFVDPIFTILDTRGLYSFEFSEGVGNAVATQVPVPAGLPLFAAAVAALGWVARRRRQLTTSSVATLS